MCTVAFPKVINAQRCKNVFYVIMSEQQVWWSIQPEKRKSVALLEFEPQTVKLVASFHVNLLRVSHYVLSSGFV
jgi:hypothetical protein